MAEKIKILIIDDEQGIRDMLSYELLQQGYDVVAVQSGDEGIEKIRHDKFNLVISDVMMPKKDGIETLGEIKKIDPDVEVIMASGFGTIEKAISAMKKGAYDFIQKPFNIEEIIALIDKALEKRDLKVVIALYEASKAIFSTIKLEDLLKIVAGMLASILPADDISIMLFDKDNKLYIAESLNLSDSIKAKARIRIGERVVGKVVEWKEPVIINGPLNNDPRFTDLEGRGDIKSAIVCPLLIKQRPIGVLSAARTKNEDNFNAADARNCVIIMSQVAQAIVNSNLYEELENKIVELKDSYRQLEQAQAQLVQSEKLAAMGELVAGVSHELNNPLTSVLGYSQLILKSESVPENIRNDVKTISAEAERCRNIIQNLLLFSRRREPRREPADMHDVINTALELVEYDFRTDSVKIYKEFASDLPKVYVDIFQMQQVFLNILTNARHAVSRMENKSITIKTEVSSNNVKVYFTDSGCGIPKENISKLFTPFFTTKDVGKGTGLGLSISYGIVKSHKGEISVESLEGKGATFIIELPFLAVA